MKILITGAGGMLAKDLIIELSKNHTIHPFKRQDLDIVDYDAVLKVFLEIKPDLIINTAAYTDVDKAEIDKKDAFLVNVQGAKNLAKASEIIKSKLIHFSTDYVFDGKKGTPYEAFDKTNPINYYGITKLKGENEVLNNCSKVYIIRTSFLYGKGGDNFITFILNQIKDNKILKIADDIISTPTSTLEISKNILKILDFPYGIYNLACKNGMSRYEFCKNVLEILSIDKKIEKIKQKDLNLIAQRPKNTSLNPLDICTNSIDALYYYLKNNTFD